MALRMFDADHDTIKRIHSLLEHFMEAERPAPFRIESAEVPPRMLAEMLEVASGPV
jgi:hypothetical protein